MGILSRQNRGLVFEGGVLIAPFMVIRTNDTDPESPVTSQGEQYGRWQFNLGSLDSRHYGVCLKLAGSLAHKFGGSFLPEGCHSFQPVPGWDVLGIAHLFYGHP